MNTDVNRVNGGLFASCGTFFMSLGLSGQKWKWHLEVGKFLMIFYQSNKNAPDVESRSSVQRWYSGMFGVGTMHWINSNSMHEVWKLNEDILKQKYRMHNLYVKVFFLRFFLIKRFRKKKLLDKGAK